MVSRIASPNLIVSAIPSRVNQCAASTVRSLTRSYRGEEQNPLRPPSIRQGNTPARHMENPRLPRL